MTSPKPPDNRDGSKNLLVAVKLHLPKLREIRDDHLGERSQEDLLYRFHSQSFKAYMLQEQTTRIFEALQELAPERQFNDHVLAIISAGTGKVFERAHNKRWVEEVGPITLAYFHADYMLRMAIKYGEELEHPPIPVPSGWAALLELFQIYK